MSAGRATSWRTVRERGGIYVAVIGVSMLLSVIGLGAMAAVRTQRLTANMSVDTIRARELARSAVELGVQMVESDSSWRTNRSNGVWVGSRSLGAGSLRIEGFDVGDADLANRPTDPLVIRGTGTVGRATQLMEVGLAASGEPIDALKYAVFTAGQLHVRSGDTLTVSGAPASTNGNLRNDGTIAGDVEAFTFSARGTITGTFTCPSPPKAMPSSDVFSLYGYLGTVISPGSNTIQNVLLSPNSNPWGTPDPDGLYVLVTGSDVTLSNVRVMGTLVVINPGKKVTIDQPCHLQPARADYPALLVRGDLVLDFDSAVPLAESSAGANFNPPGTPFEGVSNLNMTDTFPAEIRGLVHARGWVEIKKSVRIRGTLISEYTGNDGIDIDQMPEVIYDPGVLTKPIMGYMKSVKMSVEPGSWRQVVLP